MPAYSTSSETLFMLASGSKELIASLCPHRPGGSGRSWVARTAGLVRSPSRPADQVACSGRSARPWEPGEQLNHSVNGRHPQGHAQGPTVNSLTGNTAAHGPRSWMARRIPYAGYDCSLASDVSLQDPGLLHTLSIASCSLLHVQDVATPSMTRPCGQAGELLSSCLCRLETGRAFSRCCAITKWLVWQPNQQNI